MKSGYVPHLLSNFESMEKNVILPYAKISMF